MRDIDTLNPAEPAPRTGSGAPFEVLLVEDNSVDARLVEAHLGVAARPDVYVVHRVTTAAAALEKMQHHRFDAILLDLELPDVGGLDIFAAMSNTLGDTPVIVLTGHDDGDLGIRAVQLGAQDYLCKKDLDPALLRKALRYSIERSRLQREVEQSRRLSTLGRLASSVAHEFNNVLMAIQPFAELIGRLSPGNEKIENAVQHINSAISRGKGISSEILRYTRPTPPVRKAIDVLSWLNEIREQVSRSLPPTTKVLVDPPRERLAIDGDRVQLTHALVNLVDNAAEATKTVGRITISVGKFDPTAQAIWTDVSSTQPMALLTVSDTGNGIAADAMQHLFEPLFTTKRNGTGLGLPIVLQIVKQHGGEIRVRSAEGKGTTIAFTIPLSVSNPVHEDAPVPASAKIERVVLVEDDEGVAAGLEEGLRSNRIETYVATRGADAVAAVERHHPQAVILDVGLPDMSGVDVFDQLAARWPNLPVVFSTAHESLSLLARRTASPHVAYLTKPYAITELIAVLGVIIAAVQ